MQSKLIGFIKIWGCIMVVLFAPLAALVTLVMGIGVFHHTGNHGQVEMKPVSTIERAASVELKQIAPAMQDAHKTVVESMTKENGTNPAELPTHEMMRDALNRSEP